MIKTKPSQRLRSRAATSHSSYAAPAAHSTWDILLQRASHLTQVGLLGLGVFGYFYTVRPVFQNQQLQEQAAKLELEKSAAQRRLDELLQEQSKVSAEIAALRESWTRERTRNAQLSNQVSTAREQERIAKRRSTEAEAALVSQLHALEKARWELVAFDFSTAYMVIAIKSSLNNSNRARDETLSAEILRGESDWPRPYAQLIEALDSAHKKGRGEARIPDHFYAEVRAFIDSRKADLQCTPPDFRALNDSYQVQLGAIENALEAETDASIEQTRKKYASEGVRLSITDEFRRSTRSQIRLGKVFALDSGFRERLSNLRTECSDRAWTVVRDFQSMKGVPG